MHLLLMTKSHCGANNHQHTGRELVSQVVFGVHDVNTSTMNFPIGNGNVFQGPQSAEHDLDIIHVVY